MPITPKTFLAGLNLCIVLSKMPQKFLDLVKTAIFCEFLKLRFFYSRPSEVETGTSDVKPGSEVE